MWLSPHDETPSEPCDAAPEEIDVARAIDHFQSVVDWPIEAVERKLGRPQELHAATRLPAYGFDPDVPGFFWCAGQGGFGIQTAPAAAKLAASLLLDEPPDESVAHIDPAIFRAAAFRVRAWEDTGEAACEPPPTGFQRTGGTRELVMGGIKGLAGAPGQVKFSSLEPM